MWLPVLAFAFSACKESKETKSAPGSEPSKVEEVITKAVEAVTPGVPEVTPKASAAERAAKLGFAQYLPPDTEVVLAFHNGTKTADRVKASKLWQVIETSMNGGYDEVTPEVDMGGDVPEGDENPIAPREEMAPGQEETEPAEEQQAVEDEEAAPPAGGDLAGGPDTVPAGEPMGPAMLLGTEFTLAMGRGAGDQSANLLTLARRINYFQMRSLAKSFVAAVKSGDVSSLGESAAASAPEMIKDLVQDPQSGVGVVEKMTMPPMYLSFKVSPGDRENAAQQVAALIENVNMMEGMVEPVNFETGGSRFEGAKILGAKIAEELTANRADMEQQLDTATVDRLIAAVAKKNLVVASGTVGDYIVIFVGASTDDLKLATDPAQSLVGTDALAFTDGYASKDLAALMYGKKESLELMVRSAGGLADMSNGIRDGLAGSDGLGDTRDLEALFNLVAEREHALRKLTTIEAMGVVAFFEDGLKIESFGGTDSGIFDFKTPNQLSKLGDGDDVVLFANAGVDAGFDQKSREYVEALAETAYAVVKKVSEVPMTDPDAEQFKEMAQLFDEKFRPDLVGLWDAYANDFGSGLGKEGALVVDLNGAVPTVPGLPKPVLEKGRVPRITMISPVVDRAKVAASWDKMNASLINILAKVSEMAGQEIPMQKPLSSEKNGAATWFFPMPFFNDDFLPSVTVSDRWFAASTSKVQAMDLIGKAENGGDGRSGMVAHVNFKALEKYLRDIYTLYQNNAAELGGGGELTPKKKQLIDDALAVLSGYDKLTLYVRRENSQLRSSVHFKTR